MATFSRLLPSGGWIQGDDSAAVSRLTPNGGWLQINAAAGAPTTFIPIVGRGPGMALASNGGGLAGSNQMAGS